MTSETQETYHLLVLDDNPFDVELINIELNQTNNYKIDHAQNSETFMELYAANEYKAIISDYNIPGINTLDLMQEIRGKNKLIPYIFVSGIIGEEQAVQLLKSGATDYVLKDNLQKLSLTIIRGIKETEMAIANEEALLELVENEKKFRNILDFAPDATLLIDENGNIKFANNKAMQIFGYTAQEFSAIKLEQLLPDRFRENHDDKRLAFSLSPDNRTMGEGSTLIGLRKDGSEFPTDVSISPISNDKMGQSLTVYSVRDITIRKQAEEEIIKKRNLLNDAQRLAKVGSWEWDLKSNLVNWSDELYNIVGLKKTNAPHQFDLLFDFIHHDDKESIIASSKNKIKSNIKFSPQFRIHTPSGELKYLKSIEHQTLDENGEIKFITGTIQDITETVNAENEKKEMQKLALETLEIEVQSRTNQLFEANDILKQKNGEIIDSINYAKYIQRAILSKEEDITSTFPESFVLWMPKDVVSGDFFWCYSDERYDYLAVADCTGHGVPGAFMSIISNQNIRNLIENKGITNPKDILFQLNKELTATMKLKTGIVTDGMDLALVRINKHDDKLVFAGAQRPLLHFTNQGLQVINGDKSGIGGHLSKGTSNDFSEVEISYKKGDIIYLTSDGYYSQFGGEKGKKMMNKRMKALLQNNAKDTLDSQKEKLYSFYKDWQGTEEQVDDVLIIGVKL